MPFDSSAEAIMAIKPDGVFLSNGPGDPSTMIDVIEVVRELLVAEVPLFGICFGHQILGRALGFETYKLQFGHR
jgi:carbamoyl-phosphate synthase small subunit